MSRPPHTPSRGRGCLTRLVAWLLIGAVAFAGFRLVGVTVEDVGWLRDRIAAAADSLLRDADEVAELADGVTGEPGSGGEGYTFTAVQPDGVSPVTWPCAGTIPVEVNSERAPDGFSALLESAVTRINEASGFTFEVVGETGDRDFFDRGAGPVLLGFADADEVEPLAGPTAGVGGLVYSALSSSTPRTAVGGMVVLDDEAFGGRMSDATAEAIVIHELAHVLGLGHTDARGQLMRETNTYQVDFGDGDRAGLTALREHACS